MIVLITSRSVGRNRDREVALLDQYLPRVGRDSWSGRISAEGLSDLRRAISKITRRGTSLCCQVVHGAHKKRVAWRIGKRNVFNLDGHVSIGDRKQRHKLDTYSTEWNLLKPLIGLTGNFHDLGKITSGFQRMLLNSVLGLDSKKQPVRHEYVSVVLLCLMPQITGAKDDRELLIALTDEASISQLLEKAFEALPKALAIPATGSDAQVVPMPDRNAFPFWWALVQLSLVHHRLPATDITANMVIRQTSAKHMAGFEKDQDPKPFLEPAAVDVPLWRNDLWLMAVIRDARDALGTLTEGALDQSLWEWTVGVWGRTAFMLGDHGGSSKKEVRMKAGNHAEAVSNTTYANTIRVWKGKKLKVWRDSNMEYVTPEKDGVWLADSLAVHKHKVRREAFRALASLRALPDLMPCVEQDELPHALFTRADPTSSFIWQDIAADTMRNARQQRPRIGLLSFLLAGTGSGKTRAGAKVAAAQSHGDLRLNVLLSLRSLTLQTGESYRMETEFDPDQVTTLIGSDIVRLLDETSRIHVDAGTDAERAAVPAVVTDGTLDQFPSGVVEALVTEFRDGRAVRSERKVRMLQTPVLVATVDTLIDAAQPLYGGHLAATLRAMSADLVLDEADSYSEEDQVAVCRLIFLTACAGRNVTISSATLPPSLVQAIHQAYRAGWKIHAKLFGKPLQIGVGLFSEVPDAASFEVDDLNGSGDVVMEAHRRMVDIHLDQILPRPARRKVGYLDVEHAETPQAFFDMVVDLADRLHDYHAITDHVTGTRVSIGFVRWNNVRACRSFAARAFERTDRSERKRVVLCYHSRYPLAMRHNIETTLAVLLKRKVGVDGHDPILAHPLVRRHLDGTCTDVEIIISTTPILETGRDFDADWAISEPCSPHSTTQLAGRVGRHRSLHPEQANIILLNVPYRAMQRLWKRKVRAPDYAYPGLETPIRSFNGRTQEIGLPTNRADHLFDGVWQTRLDAENSLAPWRSEAPAVAVQERRKYLTLLGETQPGDDPAMKPLSVTAFTSSPDRMFDDLHGKWRALRMGGGLEALFIRQRTEEGDHWYLQTNEKGAMSGIVDSLVTMDWDYAGYEDRCLIPMRIDHAIDDVCEQLGARVASERLRQELGSVQVMCPKNAEPKMYWHCALGACDKAVDL